MRHGLDGTQLCRPWDRVMFTASAQVFLRNWVTKAMVVRCFCMSERVEGSTSGGSHIGPSRLCAWVCRCADCTAYPKEGESIGGFQHGPIDALYSSPSPNLLEHCLYKELSVLKLIHGDTAVWSERLAVQLLRQVSELLLGKRLHLGGAREGITSHG
jgi:hypothetical protein